MQRVNKAMYSLLKTWVTAETNVYPAVATEDANYPYCVFSFDEMTTKRTKDGVYAYIFRYSVDIWGCTFNQSDQVATAVMAASAKENPLLFDNPPGKIRPMLIGGQTDYSDGGYVQRLIYEIEYQGEVV